MNVYSRAEKIAGNKLVYFMSIILHIGFIVYGSGLSFFEASWRNPLIDNFIMLFGAGVFPIYYIFLIRGLLKGEEKGEGGNPV